MNIENEIALLEDILAPWQEIVGADYHGYRNHVYRMLHCSFELLAREELEDEHAQQKLIIAAAFHDIGIWTENTIDYIPPSIPPALAYLDSKGLQIWADEITLMISEHHKLRAFSDARYPLVELFRRADLVDFSLFTVRFGIEKSALKKLGDAFPNAGFHKGLLNKASKWFLKHPLNPAPMMKW